MRRLKSEPRRSSTDYLARGRSFYEEDDMTIQGSRVRCRVRSSAIEESEDGLDLSQLPDAEVSEEEDEGVSSQTIPSINKSDHKQILTTCICAEFDKAALQNLLSKLSSKPIRWKQDTIYVEDPLKLISTTSSPLRTPLLETQSKACLVFFNFGVVVMWGLNSKEQQDVLDQIVTKVCIRPLDKQFIETDTLSIHYSREGGKATIHNDTLSIPQRLQNHKGARLSVAHALAQSTKLGVFEAQGLDLLQSNAHLPQELEKHGHVTLSRKKLSKLIGRLFVHKSDVDLLSSVLDTPEYFWSKHDSLQELYKSVGTYLEIDDRLVAVKQRLEVVQEMFDMLQNRQDSHHGAVLEWIVIVLVAMEFVVGILEFCGTIGLIAPISQKSFAGRLVHSWSGDSSSDVA